MTIDIIIPSYNGKALLEKNLPIILKNSPLVKNVIVIDDGSIDETGLFIKDRYPHIKFIKNQKNLGFTKTINIAAKSSSTDYFVLLNNDVKPQAKYLENSLKHFNDNQVFAVTFSEQNASWPEISWSSGKFQFTEGDDRSHSHYSAWASGGSAIFKRSIWNQLGGFDEIYSPGYWEDIDIGWRAWKSGYRIIWEPSAKVIHEHELSFKKINQNYLSLIKQRNELIFTQKNIHDPSLANSFRSQLIKYTLKHPGYLRVILSALRALPFSAKVQYPLTDQQVFERINQPIK
jgi:O-antigen biosynthesis protein